MSPSHSSQQHSENVHSTLMVSQQLFHSQTNQHAGRATFICFSNKHTHTNSQLSQTAVWVPLNQRSIAGRETWKEQNCHNKLEGKSCVGARSHVLVLMRSTQISKGKDAYPTCTAIFLSDTDCGRVLTLCAGSALLSFHGWLCDSVS